MGALSLWNLRGLYWLVLIRNGCLSINNGDANINWNTDRIDLVRILNYNSLCVLLLILSLLVLYLRTANNIWIALNNNRFLLCLYLRLNCGLTACLIIQYRRDLALLNTNLCITLLLRRTLLLWCLALLRCLALTCRRLLSIVLLAVLIHAFLLLH